MQTNCLARAKLIYNNKNCYKLIIAFNVTQRNKNGDFIFPTQKKCAYVSGDINYATLQSDLTRIVATAKLILRTNNIEIVNNISPE